MLGMQFFCMKWPRTVLNRHCCLVYQLLRVHCIRQTPSITGWAERTGNSTSWMMARWVSVAMQPFNAATTATLLHHHIHPPFFWIKNEKERKKLKKQATRTISLPFFCKIVGFWIFSLLVHAHANVHAHAHARIHIQYSFLRKGIISHHARLTLLQNNWA